MTGRGIDSEKLYRWYDLQAPFYSLWRDDHDGPIVRRTAEILNEAETVRDVVDVGCGSGLFSIGLARRNPQWRVEGLDASAGMLAVARKQATRFGLDNVRFRVGDATRLPYDDAAFDAAVAGGLFPNLNEPAPALDEMHRVLRPGAPLVIVEVDRERMTPAFRLTFRALIFGQRLISAVLRRYRFAERWNVERSTVDRRSFEDELCRAGFARENVHEVPHHLIFDYRRSG